MARKRAQSDDIVHYNQYVVVDLVRKHAPISRADIARRTGLAVQTVSNIAEALLKADLLIEERRRVVARGQPPLDLWINSAGRYATGFALDGRKLISVLCDFSGEETTFLEQDVPNMHPDTVLPMIVRAHDRLVEDSDVNPNRMLGLGLVMPGLTEHGRFGTLVRDHPWRDDWRDRSFVEELGRGTGLPVFTDNDRTAAALSERLSGIGRNFENFLYIYFGSGIGAGLVFAGIPYRGRTGKAGEIGHMAVVPSGKPCACGNRGCLERYASLQALQSALSGQPYDTSPIDIPYLADAVDKKHPIAMAWLEEAARHLQTAIVSLENIFDTDTVLLGGVIPEAMLDALIERLVPLPPSVRSAHRLETPRIHKATVGRRAAARGAAALVILQSTVPDFSVLQSGRNINERAGVRA